MSHIGFDLSSLSPRNRYKLLSSVIMPRPIAWVTTVDREGRVNAAPYSFFNMMGGNPPVVVFGPGNRPTGSPKDTAANIRFNRSFVVNMVDEALADQMNLTATDFPEDMSEVEVVGLTTVPSVAIPVPRIAESPAQMECREVTTLQIGHTRLVVGEVLHLHIREDLVDSERYYVDSVNLKLIGRMGGGGGYVRTTDLFEMQRQSFAAWKAEREKK